MLNEKEKNIIWVSVHNVVDGYPVFPPEAKTKLGASKDYWDYLPDKISDMEELSVVEKQFIAACLYLCIQYMDENDTGAVMDCNLADIKETYAKILKEWDINEDDYKPMLDKLKEEVQKKID